MKCVWSPNEAILKTATSQVNTLDFDGATHTIHTVGRHL